MGLMPVCSQLCQTWTPFVNRESFLSFPDSARTRGVGGKQGRTLKETFEDWTDVPFHSARKALFRELLTEQKSSFLKHTSIEKLKTGLMK